MDFKQIELELIKKINNHYKEVEELKMQLVAFKMGNDKTKQTIAGYHNIVPKKAYIM